MGRTSLAVVALMWGAAAQAQDSDYAAQAFYRMSFGGPDAAMTQSLVYVTGAGQLSERTPSLEYRWSDKASEFRLAGMPLTTAPAAQATGQTLILGLRPEVFWAGVAVVVGGGALIAAAASDDDDDPVGTGSGGGGN